MENSPLHVCRLQPARGELMSFLQPIHAMIQTMHKFFAVRAGTRPEDPKDRNPRNFDNGSNLNWRGIFLFVVYTSVVLGFFLFSQNGKYRSVDGPAPRLSYDERNRGPAPYSPPQATKQMREQRRLQVLALSPSLRHHLNLHRYRPQLLALQRILMAKLRASDCSLTKNPLPG
jgi:hypothetical protein